MTIPLPPGCRCTRLDNTCPPTPIKSGPTPVHHYQVEMRQSLTPYWLTIMDFLDEVSKKTGGGVAYGRHDEYDSFVLSIMEATRPDGQPLESDEVSAILLGLIG